MDEDLRPGLAADLDGTFEALVGAHQDRLFSLALRFLGDAADAEEVVQDGFVRVYRALRGYEAKRIQDLEVRPWLSSIVLNLCRTRYRRRTRTLMAVVSGGFDDQRLPAPAADTPHERSANREATEHWADLVGRLPVLYRAAVVLRHVDGLSYQEMSHVLGRPEGTVKAQVHRGLALLRAAVEADQRQESIA
ncbi:MAG TPA: sigma-70 family RNA polymerase sigma factor [Candidatus Limnocylindrales bacterium]